MTEIRNEKRFRQGIRSSSRKFTKGLQTRQPSDIDQYLDVKGNVLFSEFKYSENSWTGWDCIDRQFKGGQRIFYKSQLLKDSQLGASHSGSVCALCRHDVHVDKIIDYFDDVKQFAVMFPIKRHEKPPVISMAYSELYDGDRWYEFNNSWNESPLSVLSFLQREIKADAA